MVVTLFFFPKLAWVCLDLSTPASCANRLFLVVVATQDQVFSAAIDSFRFSLPRGFGSAYVATSPLRCWFERDLRRRAPFLFTAMRMIPSPLWRIGLESPPLPGEPVSSPSAMFFVSGIPHKERASSFFSTTMHSRISLPSVPASSFSLSRDNAACPPSRLVKNRDQVAFFGSRASSSVKPFSWDGIFPPPAKHVVIRLKKERDLIMSFLFLLVNVFRHPPSRETRACCFSVVAKAVFRGSLSFLPTTPNPPPLFVDLLHRNAAFFSFSGLGKILAGVEETCVHFPLCAAQILPPPRL